MLCTYMNACRSRKHYVDLTKLQHLYVHENVQRVVLFTINTLDFVECHSYDAQCYSLWDPVHLDISHFVLCMCIIFEHT